MGFFKRRKAKKLEAERKKNEGRQAQLEGTLEEDYSGNKKVQHYILDCCEQIIEASKEIEEEKAEYKIVTDYLNDIPDLRRPCRMKKADADPRGS